MPSVIVFYLFSDRTCDSNLCSCVPPLKPVRKSLMPVTGALWEMDPTRYLVAIINGALRGTVVHCW